MDSVSARDHAGIRVATHHFSDHVTVVVEANGAAHDGEAANGIPVPWDDVHVNGRDFAVSRAIAQDHGGELIVDLGERERGARFTLRLPVPARASAPLA
jgi:two-component system, LuxR family, sensor kinase FixL